MTPEFSVIIPTHRGGPKLDTCLQALARQADDTPPFDVVVAFNGGQAPNTRTRARDWPFPLTVLTVDDASVCAARNAAFADARGKWILMLNDDVAAAPDLLLRHQAAHAALDTAAMVLGAAPWRPVDDERVFDRLVRNTSMLFFYDQMTPHAWYGFRHAWTLNLSLHRRFLEAEPFDERIRPVNFDDLEWAFRLEQRFDLRVWYAPEAIATHDHRYTFDQYLARESQLGGMAALLWDCNPACFHAIFRSDLDDRYLRFCRDFIVFEGRRETAAREHLDAVFARPATTLPDDPRVTADVLHALDLAHLPLKRLAFRRGLLSAREDNGATPTTVPTAEPRPAATAATT